MTLVTEHGFDRLNLSKIYAGQYESLWKWINTLALIGYEVEGFREDWGFRDGKPWGMVMTAVSSYNFYKLKKARGGDILQGDLIEISMTRSNINFLPALRKYLADINSR